jgi:hypothetical protein
LAQSDGDDIHVLLNLEAAIWDDGPKSFDRHNPTKFPQTQPSCGVDVYE